MIPPRIPSASIADRATAIGHAALPAATTNNARD